MTDEQQFVLALATLIVPTVASYLALRKTSDTHQAVNGLLAARDIEQRAIGRAVEQSDPHVGQSPTPTAVISPTDKAP
jgi:hypothetical protein